MIILTIEIPQSTAGKLNLANVRRLRLTETVVN